MAAKTVTIEFNERECVLLAAAIAVKQASVARSINAADDADLKGVYNKQAIEYADLRRKFPVS